MNISTLFHWFYCLKMQDAVLLLILCTLLFCAAAAGLEGRRWWRWMRGGLLAVLAAAILYTTLGSRGGGGYGINLIPFHSYRAVQAGGNPELYRSNFMNAALFYPAGLLGVSLLPRRWPGWCKVLLVTAVFCLMSGGIEYVQYRFALGLVEIDDVIHNTLGALLGALAMVLIMRLTDFLKRKTEEKESEKTQ